MKKTLITAAVALALTGAASAASKPVTMTTPEKDMEFTIEGIQNKMSNEGFADTNGFRVGVNLYKPSASGSFTHQFCINLGYSTANEALTDWTYTPITIGYFANTPVTDRITAYIGARVGYMSMEWETDLGNGETENDDDTGYCYSIGGGLKFKITENTQATLGYEFGKVSPSDDEKAWGENFGMQTISLGIGVKF